MKNKVNVENLIQGDVQRKIVKCGLISPIAEIDNLSAQHWDDLKKIFRESLDLITDYQFELELVSFSESAGIITGSIVKNIFENDVVLCDVSCLNPNVMLELGLRLATKKPTIIIKDRDTRFIFDINTIEQILYPRSLHYTAIQKFKIELAGKVKATYDEYLNNKYKSFLDFYGTFDSSKLKIEEADLMTMFKAEMSNFRKDITAEFGTTRREPAGLIDNPSRRGITEQLRLSRFRERERIMSIATEAVENYIVNNPKFNIAPGDFDKINEVMNQIHPTVRSSIDDEQLMRSINEIFISRML